MKMKMKGKKGKTITVYTLLEYVYYEYIHQEKPEQETDLGNEIIKNEI